MPPIVWVCLGGAMGSAARFLVARALNPPDPVAFPWGTLAVNLVGSFLIAALLGLGRDTSEAPLLSPTAHAALVSGGLGGFTTYSAFSHDTLRLLHGGAPLTAALYVVATVVGGLLAGLAGGLLARRLVG